MQFLLSLIVATAVSTQAHAARDNGERAPSEFIKITESWIAYYLKNQKFDKADKRLSWARAKFPNDPHFEVMKGTILAHRKDLAGAAQVLRSVASDADPMVRGKSLYTLAQVERASGNTTAAQTTLAELAADPTFESIAADAYRDLQAGREFRVLDDVKLRSARNAPKMGWSSSFTMTSGYDSNVTLLPDSTTERPGGAYVTPSAMVSHRGKLSGSPLEANLTVGYTRNLDADLKANNNMPLGLGALWRLPGEAGWVQKLSVGYDFSTAFVESPRFKSFSNTNAARVQREFNYGDDGQVIFALPVSYSAFPGTEAKGEEIRDGVSYGGSLANFHKSGAYRFSESLAFTRQESRGRNFRSNTFALSLSAGAKLTQKLTGQLTGGISSARFPESSNKRADTMFSAGLSFSHPLFNSEGLYGSLGANYQKNSSNVATADYSKQLYYLKVTYETR